MGLKFVLLTTGLALSFFGAATANASSSAPECSALFQDRSLTPTLEAAVKINLYKELIQSLIQHEPYSVDPMFRETEWSCTSGRCIPMSDQMQSALAGFGMPVEKAAVNAIYPQDISGLPRMGGLHFFVVDRSVPEMEIIIDPTYKQFFTNAIGEPDIFVGTRHDLIAIFGRYKDFLKPQDGSDPKDLDPAGVVETYFGFGRAETNKYGQPSRVKP